MFVCPAEDCDERFGNGDRWIDHISDAHNLMIQLTREVSDSAS